jgi:hypothetical protein
VKVVANATRFSFNGLRKLVQPDVEFRLVHPALALSARPLSTQQKY